MSEKKLKVRKKGEQRQVIDLLEDALHLLKILPASVWLMYLAGVVPFLAIFVIFWAEMTHSGLAYRYLAPGALAVTTAYVWMKCWQAYWGIAVRNVLMRENRRLTLRDRLRIARRQTMIQPIGLVAIPLSMMLLIPYPWLLAYFQNLSVCEALGEKEDEVGEQAVRYAGADKMQLGIFAFCWLKLMIGFVFFNWLTLLAALPFLLFALLGIESEFVRNPYALSLNSTFYVTALALTYLTLDPVVKAYFFLRCFYSESERSGMDLMASLKRLAKPVVKLVAFVLIFSVFVPPGTVYAEAESSMPPEQFEQAVKDVSAQKKYIWRHPTEIVIDRGEPPGWAVSIREFFNEMGERFNEIWEKVRGWLRDLFKNEQENIPKDALPTEGISGVVKFLLIGLLLVLAGIVGVIFYRSLKSRRIYQAAAMGNPVAEESPDLTLDDVSADSLPINRWLEYARELASRGEYRLAMRAVFLAQIAFLAEHRLIILARFKSNRDYARELYRRSHAYPVSFDSFNASSRLFESVWYGNYKSGPEELQVMEQHFNNMSGRNER